MVDWINLSQTAGTGNVTITVSASSYSELLERSTSLLVSGSGASATVNLIQRFDNSFSISPTLISDIPSLATTQLDYRNIAIYSDYSWSIVSKPNWVTFSAMSGVSNATITMLANDNSGDMRTGEVVFQNANNLTRTLSLVQNANPANEFLLFVIRSNGEIKWKQYESEGQTTSSKTIYYSKNGSGSWSQIASDTAGTASISVSSGDVVRFFGSNSAYGNSAYAYNGFETDVDFEIMGNIMSLRDYDFGLYHTAGDWAYCSLFANCPNVLNAGELYLPASAVGVSSYSHMFDGCGSMVSAPSLPATSLSQSCYEAMFEGCVSLSEAPNLPATILANDCYANMFWGCSNISTPPQISATTIAEACFANMFYDCTSLSATPVLSYMTLARECYAGMFTNCVNLVTPPALPATALTEGCYDNMFCGCTGLTSAPVLPATTLADRCYAFMFSGCTSLTSAPDLLATTIGTNSYMFMFYNCSNLNYIKCLGMTINIGGTFDWVNGVAETGTFVKNPNKTDWETGVHGIPSGWIVINYDMPPEITVASSMAFIGAGQTLSTTVMSNCNWEAQASDSWISISPSSGSYGSTVVAITASANTGTSRNGSIVFSSNSSAITSTTITQAGDSRAENKAEYLTLIFSGSTNLTAKKTTSSARAVSVSVNNGAWSSTTLTNTNTNYTLCSVVSGDVVKIKSEVNDTYGVTFNFTAPAKVKGNILSLLYGDNFSAQTATKRFDKLFYSTPLTDASELYLPNEVVQNSYYQMFSFCTGLTAAPMLPATTLATSCYSGMFDGCRNLIYAPELPAPTLANWCYESMFWNCTSLNYIKCLATDISALSPTSYWVNNVSANGTFVKSPNMSNWTTGVNGIPSGWTVVDAS